MDSAIQ